MPPPVLTTQMSSPPSAATASATRPSVPRGGEVTGSATGATPPRAASARRVAAHQGHRRALGGERGSDGPTETG